MWEIIIVMLKLCELVHKESKARYSVNNKTKKYEIFFNFLSLKVDCLQLCGR